MKILMAASQFPPVSSGGVSYVSFNLYRSFLKLGHEVHVLAYGAKKAGKDYAHVIRMGHSPSGFLVQSFKHANRLGLEAYHVILMQSSAGAGLIPQLKKIRHPNVIAIAHVSTYAEMKAINTVRGDNGEVIGRPSLDEYRIKYIHSPVLIGLEHYTFKNSDKTVSICEATRQKIIVDYGLKPDKVHTIHNGVDLERFAYRLPGRNHRIKRARKENRIVLFVGVLRRIRKGIYHLLELFRCLNRSRKDIDLVIIGDGGHGSAVKRLAARYDLSNGVYFLGNVDNDHLRDYYSQADITIVPSIYEGLPLVILESLACGTPVAATDVSGNQEIISEANGVLLPPYDLDAWKRKVSALIDKNLNRDTVRNSIIHLNWDLVAQRYIDYALHGSA